MYIPWNAPYLYLNRLIPLEEIQVGVAFVFGLDESRVVIGDEVGVWDSVVFETRLALGVTLLAGDFPLKIEFNLLRAGMNDDYTLERLMHLCEKLGCQALVRAEKQRSLAHLLLNRLPQPQRVTLNASLFYLQQRFEVIAYGEVV